MYFLGLGQPHGYTLFDATGKRRNRIRGDLIPENMLVIVQDGIHFVRTKERDADGFEIYREGHRTFEYLSSGE